MLIKNEFEVAEPVEKVWQFFENIPQVAACLPGAELTEDLGDDRYKGKVAIRMGPIRLQFAGTADITERDEAARRVVVHASGADERGRGQATMVVTAALPAMTKDSRCRSRPSGSTRSRRALSTRRRRPRCPAMRSTSAASSFAPRCRSAASSAPPTSPAPAVHLVTNTAITGATFDIDGGQQLLTG